jgi:hypothetical protein
MLPAWPSALRDAMTGRVIEPRAGGLDAATVLARFPVALLVPVS